MELEMQCCAIEQSKELVRLGLNIETCFEWVRFESDCIDSQLDNWVEPILMSREAREACEAHIVFHYPAPTVAELGDIFIKNGFGNALPYKNNDNWEMPDFLFEADSKLTEAQARVEALSWLIEENYIKVEDLRL